VCGTTQSAESQAGSVAFAPCVASSRWYLCCRLLISATCPILCSLPCYRLSTEAAGTYALRVACNA
jgi:hypothetical protein